MMYVGYRQTNMHTLKPNTLYWAGVGSYISIG